MYLNLHFFGREIAMIFVLDGFGMFWLVTKNPEMDLPKSASLFTPTWGDFVGGA